MIEDKKHGIKIAEDKEEAFWHNIKARIEQENIQAKASIELNELTLPFIEEKLKQWKTDKK